MSAARRQFVIIEAREWLGTPFAWGQRVKNQGIDCIQYVVAVGLAVGALDTDFLKGYPYPSLVELRSQSRVLEVFEPHFTRIDADQVQPGDVGYFRTLRNFPIHFGIITERGIIHASDQARKVVETRIPPELKLRLISYFKYKGL